MRAFEIGAGGYWTGQAIDLEEEDSAPNGWTRTDVPDMGVGEFAVWEGINWRVTDEPYTPTPLRDPDYSDLIDAERDRRIHSGFMFNGVLFQNRIEDQKRIAGAGTLALGAMVANAQPGDYRWAEPDQDFEWIAADNSRMKMDAQTTFAFGKAAAIWESQHVFAGSALKSMNPIPEDFADDFYWPK